MFIVKRGIKIQVYLGKVMDYEEFIGLPDGDKVFILDYTK